jgi:hypothetical protein
LRLIGVVAENGGEAVGADPERLAQPRLELGVPVFCNLKSAIESLKL